MGQFAGLVEPGTQENEYVYDYLYALLYDNFKKLQYKQDIN